MTIKTLLFLLFVYICLVWVGAAYLHTGEEIREFGLKWTGVGLIAVFVFIVGSHLLHWWRQWRARPRLQQKPSVKPAPIVHEDDAALAEAIALANATLAKAPGYSGQRDPLYRLPWRLLIGPEGSGKTSIFLNSGVEPKLLAGHAVESGPNAPTRVCNVWLAKNTIFVEIAGRAFDGDPARWTQLLRVLGGTESVPLWRRLLGKREQRGMLRGVVGFCDLREFTAASGDPQRFERFCRNWHDRLRAIGEAFGTRFPVYQLITKCDGVPFFQEFFHQLPESDSKQVLGCTLAYSGAAPPEPGEAFAEVESKRLTKAFRALHQSLAERRITQLAYETNPDCRPAIYEFPRELKRIRGSIVQFLIDGFRPDALRPGPFLRGYYFTAIREVEMDAAVPLTTTEDWQTIVSRSPSALEATQMFKPDTSIPSIGKERSKRMARRWAFVSDLFYRVILVDPPLQTAPPVDTRFEIYRRRVFAGVLASCGVLCLAFLISWIGNRNLLNDVRSAAVLAEPQKPVTLTELRKLDALRIQVERLRNGASWWLHSGLYSGNRIMHETRTAYFRRFHQLILADLNGEMTGRLKALPAAGTDTPYDPVYRTLKTYLTVSSGSCPAEPVLVSEVLKGVRDETDAINGPEWQKVSDQQIEFYASELVYGNPVAVAEDGAAVQRGRAYLRNIAGVERIYNGILSNVRKSVSAPKGLGEFAPDYAKVLRSQKELPVGFTVDGWGFVKKASADLKSAVIDDCVFGESGELPSGPKDQDLAPEIQRLYVRDYIRSWREYLAGFSVVSYNSADDAARKLEILASNRSPLLGLFLLAANETNFPEEGLPKQVEKLIEKAGKMTGIVTGTRQVPDVSGTPAEIFQSFQPVHEVVPPQNEILANAKHAAAYLNALTDLRSAMQAIAGSTDVPSRQAASQAAAPIYNAGMNAVGQIARGFKRNGLDETVQRLLEEPIRLAKPFIPTDPGRITANEINGRRSQLCSNFGSTFDKYPFRRSSTQDASLSELSTWFAPETGEIWKFQMGPLGPLTQFENSQWKAKDPAQTPQVTSEMLAFLNRAQAIMNAFYPKGATQPQLIYSLRPRLEGFGSSTVEFEVDGQLHLWTNVLQKQFVWPAPPGAKPGAIARIRTGNTAHAFASHSGPWGIFRVMDDAEPRASQGTIEWKYAQGDPIQPAPVRMDFPDFPNGADVFHRGFFEGMRCPAVAVR